MLSKGTDDAHLFLGTFFRPIPFSRSVLFSITCTSVIGAVMFGAHLGGIETEKKLCTDSIARFSKNPVWQPD